MVGEVYAQADGDILYNVKRVEIEELDPATGAPPVSSPKKFVISCDSEVGLEPEILEGEKKTLRDSTKLLAQAKEEDLFAAMNLKLTTCRFNPELLPMIQGGTLKMGTESNSSKITGYSAPTGEEATTNKKYFKTTIYIENREGDDIVNYIKFTFFKCRGSIMKFDFKKEFFAPEFDIRCTENKKLSKPIYDFDYVDALPV